jgi:hypothetical protein
VGQLDRGAADIRRATVTALRRRPRRPSSRGKWQDWKADEHCRSSVVSGSSCTVYGVQRCLPTSLEMTSDFSNELKSAGSPSEARARLTASSPTTYGLVTSNEAVQNLDPSEV